MALQPKLLRALQERACDVLLMGSYTYSPLVESMRGGTAVNPLSVKFGSRALLEGQEMDRFKSHLAKLMAIGTKTPAPTPLG